MKQLTIGHLAPYLPYGLGLKCESGDIGVLTALDENDSSICIRFDDDLDVLAFRRELEDITPILRPLSQLIDRFDTKECGNCRAIDYISTSIKDEKQTILIVSKGIPIINSLEYWKIARLLELHFDVFGLIDAGLAIEKGGDR